MSGRLNKWGIAPSTKCCGSESTDLKIPYNAVEASEKRKDKDRIRKIKHEEATPLLQSRRAQYAFLFWGHFFHGQDPPTGGAVVLCLSCLPVVETFHVKLVAHCGWRMECPAAFQHGKGRVERVHADGARVCHERVWSRICLNSKISFKPFRATQPK